MGHILVDEADHDVAVNLWNWGALHEVVRLAGVIPEEAWGPMRGGFGPPLAAEHVAKLRDFLETQVLPRTLPGQRVLPTGEVTSGPDDGKMHYDDAELWKNYSLNESVLRDVIAFLRVAQGEVKVR